METQKIVNLLNDSDNENTKFATKKWYVIDNESKGNYSHEKPIKILTSSLKSSLYDYSDACILVTGNISVTGRDANTKVTLKNSATFTKCITEINEIFIDDAEHVNITMPMHNLIEYIAIIILILQESYDILKEIKKLEILIWQTIILYLLSTSQILLVILIQMEQTEKRKV